MPSKKDTVAKKISGESSVSVVGEEAQSGGVLEVLVERAVKGAMDSFNSSFKKEIQKLQASIKSVKNLVANITHVIKAMLDAHMCPIEEEIEALNHNQFLFDHIPRHLPAFSHVYYKVLSLVLFSFRCTQALSVKSLRRLQFHIIYMLMTHKFTFHSHPTSLMTVSPCSPPFLTKFMPGSLRIVFQSAHQRLNSS